MTANNAAKPTSRRRKTSSSQAATSAIDFDIEATKAMSGEKTAIESGADAPKDANMASENVVKISARPAKDEKSALQLQPVGSPIMPSELEIVGTVSEAGIRPIGASHLELAGSFLNGRPIEANHLKVHEMLPGNRPIFESDFHSVQGLVLLGDRPIMISDPTLMAASTLPGGRPIAANDLDAPNAATLMGYLD